MESTKKEQELVPQPCVLLGMHRSGTSFVASWLHGMSIRLGNQLLQASVGNSFGHFEDKEFLTLHRRLLLRKGVHYLATDQPLVVVDDEVQAAKALFEDRLKLHGKAPWGWKDPRTCLFLDLWSKVCGGFNGFCVYRDVHAVTDSILRRHQKELLALRNKGIATRLYRSSKKRLELLRLGETDAALWTAERVALSWVRHNSAMLDHIESNLDDRNWLLLSYSKILKNWRSVVRLMQDQWGYELEVSDPNEKFDKGSISTSPPRLHLTSEIQDKVSAVEDRLERLESVTMERLSE